MAFDTPTTPQHGDMSTDLHDRPTAAPQPPAPRPEPTKPGLSATQIAGGALASMTAAFLGSRLGVAGTVAGAALVSVVIAVGGTVYTSSLRRTQHHVRRAWATRAPGGSPGLDHRTGSDARETEAPTPAAPAGERSEDPVAPGPPARLRWKPVLVGALAIFALAATVLTGLELATGRALSGGPGTTIGQVSEGGPRQSAPTSKPGSSARPTPSPTTQPSAGPSSALKPTTPASSSPSLRAPSSTAPSSTAPLPSTGPTASSAPSRPVPSGPAGSAPASTP